MMYRYILYHHRHNVCFARNVFYLNGGEGGRTSIALEHQENKTKSTGQFHIDTQKLF